MNIDAIREELIRIQRESGSSHLTNDQIYAFCRSAECPGGPVPFHVISTEFINSKTRIAKRQYDMTLTGIGKKPESPSLQEEGQDLDGDDEMESGITPNIPAGISYVPRRDRTYTQWGESRAIRAVVESGMFFPVFISGDSGNGKTIMVEQTCALTKREFIRVQISPDTDEDDLLGGFRLRDGETVFAKGPVITAMERGAILLIDEIDRGTNKIMCLQGVLEGKPVMIKKTGEVVRPANGFNVFATANTRGQGSEDGKYVAAQVIDEAFLERFSWQIEQKYPLPNIEKSIVLKHMNLYGCPDRDFCEHLVTWANTTRKTRDDGAFDECISTRRLCHIVKAYAIFKDRLEAIQGCTQRFEVEVRTAFVETYKKIDKDATKSKSLASIASAVKKSVDLDEFVNTF